jgi:hypothetical protein
MRDQRGLRVVEHGALLAVQPARALVDLRDDRPQADGKDLVAKLAAFAVEDLSLPEEQVRDLGRDVLQGAARVEKDRPLPSPVGIGPAGLFAKSPSSSAWFMSVKRSTSTFSITDMSSPNS